MKIIINLIKNGKQTKILFFGLLRYILMNYRITIEIKTKFNYYFKQI